RSPPAAFGAALAGRLLGAVVRAVPADGAMVRGGRARARAGVAPGQGRHRGRTGARRALRDPQHPDAGVVRRRARDRAPVRRARHGADRRVGTYAAARRRTGMTTGARAPDDDPEPVAPDKPG